MALKLGLVLKEEKNKSRSRRLCSESIESCVLIFLNYFELNELRNAVL